jgi:hypothetical protein
MFLVGIESVGRLVHDEDRRIVQDRLRQADAPLESFGQRVDRLVEDGVEFRLGDGRVDPRLHIAAFVAPHFGDEAQELARSHVAIGRRAFRQVADGALGRQGLGFDIVAAHPHPAGGRRQKARDHLHGGGFAGAVRPQKAQHFAFLDLEVDSRDSFDGTEALGQFVYFDHGSNEQARR